METKAEGRGVCGAGRPAVRRRAPLPAALTLARNGARLSREAVRSRETRRFKYRSPCVSLFGPHKNLSGHVFGSWTVVRYAYASLWDCRCRCGCRVLLGAHLLRAGHRKMCPRCARALGDGTPPLEVGQRVKSMRVIERLAGGSYRCRCQCGATCVRRRDELLRGVHGKCRRCYVAMVASRPKKPRKRTAKKQVFAEDFTPHLVARWAMPRHSAAGPDITTGL